MGPLCDSSRSKLQILSRNCYAKSNNPVSVYLRGTLLSKFFISSVLASDNQCPMIMYFGLPIYIYLQGKAWFLSINYYETA